MLLTIILNRQPLKGQEEISSQKRHKNLEYRLCPFQIAISSKGNIGTPL